MNWTSVATRAAVIVGGPRDGEQRLRVPAVEPPPQLPGCCIRPEPIHGRCRACRTTGPDIDRYELAEPEPGAQFRYEYRRAEPKAAT